MTDDTIGVKPGIYNDTLENFPLNLTNANVTLEAIDGPTTTIINGTGYTMDAPCVNVTADRATILGFTITNGHDGIYLAGSTDSEVRGNNITKNEVNGMTFIQANNTLITDNNITDNGLDGINLVEGSSNNLLTHNLIKKNDDGIYTSNTANNTFKYNNITNNEDGLRLWGLGNNTVTSNTITHCVDGIDLGKHSHNNTIRNNSIRHHLDHGIRMDANDTTIQGNTIADNHRGIELSSASNNTITGNLLLNNGEYGIYLYGSSVDNLVYVNNFIDENQHALDESGGNYFNNSTMGNYWDDYNGSDVDPTDGIGDQPYNISGSGKSKDYLPLIDPFAIPDLLPPSVIILEPEEDATIQTLDVTVRWNGSDTYGSIDYYEIKNESGDWKNVAMSTNYTFTDLGVGDHTVWVRAVDTAGNKGTASVHFTVEITAPVVTIDHPTNTTYAKSQLDINVTVTASFPIETVVAEVDATDNVTLASYANDLYHATYSFDEGVHTLRIYAIDAAGNVNDTETVSFTVLLEDEGEGEGEGLPIELIIGGAIGIAAVLAVAVYYVHRKNEEGQSELKVK